MVCVGIDVAKDKHLSLIHICKHEGRGSWTFARYLADTDYAGKTNAFWDKIKGRLDFQKYCETNGYEGIDYFLIALEMCIRDRIIVLSARFLFLFCFFFQLRFFRFRIYYY